MCPWRKSINFIQATPHLMMKKPLNAVFCVQFVIITLGLGFFGGISVHLWNEFVLLKAYKPTTRHGRIAG